MAYNITPYAVERKRSILEQILQEVMKEEKTLVIRTVKPKKHGFQIREAMKSAKELNIAPFHELNGNIHIKVNSDNITVTKKAADEEFVVEVIDPILTVEEPVNQFAIVEYLMKNKPSRVIFKNVESGTDLVEIWTRENNYTITEEVPLTIKKNEHPE